MTHLLTVLLTVTLAGFTWASDRIVFTGGEMEFPCTTLKQFYKKQGLYESKNITATRGVIFRDTAILALPRFKKGVPATLGMVSLKSKYCEATLSAYPCWSLQSEGDCDSFQNVVDLYLDVSQNILWVLDTGIVDYLENPRRLCAPKVVAVDPKNGSILKYVDLSNLATATSRLQYVVSDTAKNGNLFLYVSDAASRAILVYNVTGNSSCRVILPPAVTIGSPRRDMLYLALLRRPDASACLVFTYFSSTRLFSIKTVYLQTGAPIGKIHDIGPKPRPMVILGTDNGSALFFRYESETEIYRWDILDCYTPANFQKVYQGTECLYPTQVIPDYGKNRMRVLESSFPDFFRGTVGCGTNHALVVL